MKKAKSYGIREDRVLRGHIELSRAFMKLRSKESAWLQSSGLTLPQFAILESLYHLGHLSVGEITKLVLSTPGNITVVVKNLTSKGLISSITDEKDKRIKRLKIADAGAKIIESIFPDHLANLTSCYSEALSDEELQMLSILLRKLEKAQ